MTNTWNNEFIKGKGIFRSEFHRFGPWCFSPIPWVLTWDRSSWQVHMVEATHPMLDRKEETGPNVLIPPTKSELLNLHHHQQHQSVGHTFSTLSFEGHPSSGLHQQEALEVCVYDFEWWKENHGWLQNWLSWALKLSSQGPLQRAILEYTLRIAHTEDIRLGGSSEFYLLIRWGLPRWDNSLLISVVSSMALLIEKIMGQESKEILCCLAKVSGWENAQSIALTPDRQRQWGAGHPNNWMASVIYLNQLLYIPLQLKTFLQFTLALW